MDKLINLRKKINLNGNNKISFNDLIVKACAMALAKNPEQITLLTIVEAVDPELLKVSYDSVGESGAKVSETWDGVRVKLVDYLSEITLDSIIEKNDSKMYYI